MVIDDKLLVCKEKAYVNQVQAQKLHYRLQVSLDSASRLY